MKNLSFKEHFSIQIKTDVEFLDIPLNNDLEAFICPFLIANNRQDKIADSIYAQMQKFLQHLNRDFIKTNDRNQGLLFLSKLHEPNEYHLGYSDTNKGKAIASSRAETIFDSLANNVFAKQGVTITNEAHNVLLLVSGIGQDIMSDTIANVCRNIFAEFTLQQCIKHSIDTSTVTMHYYDVSTSSWKDVQFLLPSYKGKPIILIPKMLVSSGRSYSNNYNRFVAGNYISADLLSGKIAVNNEGKLIATLKDGTKKAIVKEIIRIYGKPKSGLIEFVLEYNQSLYEFQKYAKEHYPELDLSRIKN